MWRLERPPLLSPCSHLKVLVSVMAFLWSLARTVGTGTGILPVAQQAQQ